MPKQTFFNLPEEKRRGIVKDAAQVFAAHPIQDVSINALIKAVHISTGSFYQYFEDKEDLYFYIMSHFMDEILAESKKKNAKIDLFDKTKKKSSSRLFPQIKSKKYYQEIFVDNFNRAPLPVKREWILNNLIGGKYMDVYDDSFLCQEGIDPVIQENRKIVVAMAMSLPVLLQKFVDRNTNNSEYVALHRMCTEIIRLGALHYHQENEE